MAKLLARKLLQLHATKLQRPAALLPRQNRTTHESVLTGQPHYCHTEAKQRPSIMGYRRDSNTCTCTCSKTQSFHTSSLSRSSVSDNHNAPGGSWTTENLIEAWFNEVSTFGTVCVHKVPFDIHIQPLSPMDYPELDKSIVKLYYNNAGSQPLLGHQLSDMGKLCKTNVCVDGGKLDVSCDVPHGVQLPLVCVITVPLKFDVDIKGSDGTAGIVAIKGLESDSVSVHLKQGDCHLSSLKTRRVTVQCDNGSITSRKQLLGTISLRCGKNGSISGDRLQGVSVDCTTEAGDIDIKTVYADKSSCRSLSGSLHVRDCHGDMSASSDSGNLTVDSMDGKFSADLGTGSADVYIIRQEGVHIRSEKGDITLRFSEDGSCSLDLDAAIIEKDDSVLAELSEQGKGYLRAETAETVKASAPQGKISLKKQDWLSAIKLQSGKTTS